MCKIIEFLLGRQNWNIFSSWVFELGQHEQKKYLSDANIHSTDKDALPWKQVHTLSLVLSHCLQYSSNSSPISSANSKWWDKNVAKIALDKSSWGIVSHMKSLKGLFFCWNVNEKMQYREIFSEWNSLKYQLQFWRRMERNYTSHRN